MFLLTLINPIANPSVVPELHRDSQSVRFFCWKNEKYPFETSTAVVAIDIIDVSLTPSCDHEPSVNRGRKMWPDKLLSTRQPGAPGAEPTTEESRTGWRML